MSISIGLGWNTQSNYIFLFLFSFIHRLVNVKRYWKRTMRTGRPIFQPYRQFFDVLLFDGTIELVSCQHFREFYLLRQQIDFQIAWIYTIIGLHGCGVQQNLFSNNDLQENWPSEFFPGKKNRHCLMSRRRIDKVIQRITRAASRAQCVPYVELSGSSVWQPKMFSLVYDGFDRWDILPNMASYVSSAWFFGISCDIWTRESKLLWLCWISLGYAAFFVGNLGTLHQKSSLCLFFEYFRSFTQSWLT